MMLSWENYIFQLVGREKKALPSYCLNSIPKSLVGSLAILLYSGTEPENESSQGKSYFNNLLHL